MKLSWTDPSDSTIIKYQYQQKEGDGDYGEWTDVPNSIATTTSYTVPALTNETTYTFQVRAVNADGNGPESDEVSATPGVKPATPTGLAATARNGQVWLTWDDPGDDSITGYDYWQRKGKGEDRWAPVPDSTATVKVRLDGVATEAA